MLLKENNNELTSINTSSKLILLQEIDDLLLIGKNIRVAGIIKDIDLINEEMIIFYECKSVKVDISKYQGSRIDTLESGKIVEVIGQLSSIKDKENIESLLISAEIVRLIENMNLHLYQLSILLRRKMIDSKEI